jgi:hypothetical protein
VGDETKHLDEWWGNAVSIGFCFFGIEEMTKYLKEAGFEVTQIAERDHYPNIE